MINRKITIFFVFLTLGWNPTATFAYTCPELFNLPRGMTVVEDIAHTAALIAETYAQGLRSETVIKSIVAKSREFGGMVFARTVKDAGDSNRIDLTVDFLPDGLSNEVLIIRTSESLAEKDAIRVPRIEYRLRSDGSITIFSASANGKLSGDTLMVSERTSHGVSISIQFLQRADKPILLESTFGLSEYFFGPRPDNMLKKVLESALQVAKDLEPNALIYLDLMDQVFIYSNVTKRWELSSGI